MYACCDDANRRPCNQVFFQAIYIEDDGEIRAGYARLFNALCDPELQADPLTWAQHAKTQPEDTERAACQALGRKLTPEPFGVLPGPIFEPCPTASIPCQTAEARCLGHLAACGNDANL